MTKKQLILGTLAVIAIFVSISFLNSRQPISSFSEKQVSEYNQIYQNTEIIFLRQAFNAYLENDSSKACIIAGAVNQDKRDGIITGLDSFSKDYYKSKFIVATIDDNSENGKDIQIIFQEKPDRIFYAWVGQNPQGQTCLIGFNSKENFDQQELKQLLEKYKPLISDPKYSI